MQLYTTMLNGNKAHLLFPKFLSIGPQSVNVKENFSKIRKLGLFSREEITFFCICMKSSDGKIISLLYDDNIILISYVVWIQ